MSETNIVRLHKMTRKPAKQGHEKMADDIRKLYRKLCAAIDQATAAGLNVEVYLDSNDTYGGSICGNRVRTRDVKITKKL